MLRIHLILAIHLVFNFFSFAQEITFTPSTANFGEVKLGDFSTLVVRVKNNSGGPVFLDTFYFTKSVYTTVFTGKKLMNPDDSLSFSITYIPRDNVRDDAQMVLCFAQSLGCVALPITGFCNLKNNYYNATMNLWDAPLKDTLKSILARNYVSLGYNAARDQMYANIDNEGGTVTCVYTGRQAQFSTRAGATANNFNTEHTYPQSMFGSQEPMQSDIFHLFPVDENANTARLNYPFGIVTSPTWQAGGSKGREGLFEPRDEHKGTAARALLYMGVRYGNMSNFLTGQEEILRQWAFQFPPNTKDSMRNADVFKLQRNRNPFIDHPHFLNRIWSISTFAIRPADRLPAVFPRDTATLIYLGNGNFKIVLANTGRSEMKYFASLPFTSPVEVSPEQGIIQGGGFVELTLSLKNQTLDNEVFTNLEIQINDFPDDTTINVPVRVKVIQIPGSTGKINRLNLSVYPNPFHSQISVSGDIKPGSELHFFNTLGEKVLEYVAGNTPAMPNTSTLSPGVYLLQVKSGSDVVFLKVVKQ